MSMTRTDLALESVQAAAKVAREDAVPGVRSQENRREGYAITHIRIDSDVGAQALGKPVGRYVTVDLGPYFRREEDYFDRGVRCLAQELRGMLPEGPAQVGLQGGRRIRKRRQNKGIGHSMQFLSKNLLFHRMPPLTNHAFWCKL